MTVTASKSSGVVFRSLQQYRDHYKADEPMPDYTGKDDLYIEVAEGIRKTLAELDRKRAEEAKQAWMCPKNFALER